MPKSEIRLAVPEDDVDLRRILRTNPIVGEISMTFEREPNYFDAARVEAPDHQIIVGVDLGINRVVGMGARSIRPLFVNGSAVPFGYLSQFRIDQNYRAMRKSLTQAWQYLKELHQDGKSPFYYTSIIEDNLPARKLLTRGLPGLPKYTEYARMHTLVIYSRRKKQALPLPPALQLEHGSDATKNEIIACLQRNLARYQFAPCWDENLLFKPEHTPGLSPEDFFIIRQGGQVKACVALWDQGAFKQSVIRGYSNRIRNFRWLVNLAARATGRPTLPPVNTKVKHAYASHLAVDADDPVFYEALLRGLYNEAVKRDYAYFMLGLCDDHLFLARTQTAYPHIDYISILYLVSWDPDSDPRQELDDRLPAPEIAIL